MARPQRSSLSIVSHGHGRLIRSLLLDIQARAADVHEVIVTLNIAEDESFLAGFSDLPIKVIRNDRAKGFGANHNTAFHVSTGDCFVVLNPDLRLGSLDLGDLLGLLDDPAVGLVAPVVYSSDGQLQDSARRFPTIARLLQRRLSGATGPDYILGDAPLDVDWIAGMFMAFRRGTYAEIGGFDERYFMYFEDVDLCRRLHERGYKVLLATASHVIHDAQRASRRKLNHLAWHMSSAARFLLTPPAARSLRTGEGSRCQ